jgi:hypothetical protein
MRMVIGICMKFPKGPPQNKGAGIMLCVLPCSYNTTRTFPTGTQLALAPFF